MYKCLVLSLFVFLFLTAGRARPGIPATKELPFKGSFIENKGQWDKKILFKADLPYGSLFLEKRSLTFNFLDDKALNRLLTYKFSEGKNAPVNPPPVLTLAAHAYKVSFIGANPEPNITSSQPLPEYYNYFLGKDDSRWVSHVNLYNKISYQSLYEGVDLEISRTDGHLKYTFFLNAGSDASKIKLEYTGVKSLKTSDGKLIITTTVNSIEEMKPVAWQNGRNGEKITVPCRYSLHDGTVSFLFPRGVDNTLPLVIDPVLVFSTYSGSPVDNWGYTATYDNHGYLYTGGNAFALGYPTVTGSYQLYFGGGTSDIVISKYDTTGSFMIYSTYLGGAGSEVPTSLIINNNEELLVLGISSSADFPVTGQSYSQTFQGGSPYLLTNVIEFAGGSDLVISKFSADGSSLLASTFFGGSGNDGINSATDLKHNYADDARGEIKTDINQNIYICSSTKSDDLPVTPGALQQTFGGVQDACVVKFDPTLTYVLWSTYLGGSVADAGYGVIIDDSGRIYVAGGTASDDFPVTTAAMQQSFQGGSCDGYITCLDGQASSILYSTYLGSSEYDQVYFIDRDQQDNIYVLGQTAAPGSVFITNAAWSMPGGGQFISKLHPDLSGFIFSTTFGTGNGGPDISPTAFMVDNCNYIYLSGWGCNALNGFGGTAGLPVTPDAHQTNTDDKDYYFLVMQGDASALVYATFFGGSSAEHVDGGTSRFDKKGRIYQSVCAGCGGIDDFPTTEGAWSNINGSTNCNNAVIKFDFRIPLVIADFTPPPSGCSPDTVDFHNTSYFSGTGIVQYFWDFGDGSTSTDANPSHPYSSPGIYWVTLAASSSSSCNLSDTTGHWVYILGNSTVHLPSQDICIGQSIQLGIQPLADPSLTYSWFPSADLNNPLISNPVATPTATTDYYLLISNALCSDTVRQHIRVFDLKVNAGNDTIVCTDNLLLTAVTAEDSVTFHWSTNAQFTDTLNSAPEENTALVTLHNQENWFWVSITNGLCSAVDSIKVSFSILISPGGGQDPSCHGSCNGSATVSLSGGIPPFTYLWNNGQTTSVVTGLCEGLYSVTVTDSAGCISVTSIQLTDPPPMVITLTAGSIPCTEVCNGTLSSQVTGGTGEYLFLWNTGSTTEQITGLCQGTYTLSVTDEHQCLAIQQGEIAVNSIFLGTEIGTDPDSIFQGLSVQLQATLIEGCTYTWSPPAGLSDPLIHNPVATPVVTTVYTLTITDTYGCQYIDSVKVIVMEVNCREPFLYIPSAFTPNGDNKNDVFHVKGNFIGHLQLSVYDRWGNRVFETSNPSDVWDGTYKGQDCEPGVYVYHLELECYNKETFRKKGNITLIR